MKGGLLSVINENNEIIAWVWTSLLLSVTRDAQDLKMCQRLCQSQSSVEIKELLDGYRQRCGELQVTSPKMVVVNNCCHVRSAIAQVFPDAHVVLDIYHFLAWCASVSLFDFINY